jgi:sulfopyruvate decarboxylase TPP-binding subunit
MKDWLNHEDYFVATDEAEAVALACGEYLVTGRTCKVAMGENGLLNALDTIITLSQLQGIPIELHLFVREDEPQHKMVTDFLKQLLELYQINAEIHG